MAASFPCRSGCLPAAVPAGSDWSAERRATRSIRARCPTHTARRAVRGGFRAGGIPAGDDGGGCQRPRHHLHGAFARQEVVEARPADLHEAIHEHVRAADENRARFPFRRSQLVGDARERQRDAGRLEAETRGNVRGAQRVGGGAEDNRRIGAIGNQIGVGVAVPAVDRERIGEIEGPGRSTRRGVGGPTAIAGRIGRELVGIDRWRQRPLVQSRAGYVDMLHHARPRRGRSRWSRRW